VAILVIYVVGVVVVTVGVVAVASVASYRRIVELNSRIKLSLLDCPSVVQYSAFGILLVAPALPLIEMQTTWGSPPYQS
jgi:hypothetical protein